jgi:uncharacterized protein YndB with AHSA1/START domain
MADLTLEYRFDRPPAAVFDGFLAMYGPDRPDWIIDSDLDLRVGGRWTATFHPPGLDAFQEHRQITAVDRPRLLAYDVEVRGADTFRVSARFEFTADGDGTRLAFRQTGFPTEATRDEFAGAWPAVFAQLAERIT